MNIFYNYSPSSNSAIYSNSNKVSEAVTNSPTQTKSFVSRSALTDFSSWSKLLILQRDAEKKGFYEHQALRNFSIVPAIVVQLGGNEKDL